MDDRTIEKFADWNLSQFDVGSIPRGWRNFTGSPAAAAGLLAAGTFIPAYMFTPQLARAAVRAKHKFMPGTPQAMQEELQLVEEEAPRMRGRVAGTLAALAAGLTLANSYVPKSVSPEGGGWRSLFNWNPKPPDYKATVGQVQDVIGSLRKTSSDRMNALADFPTVPIKYSLDLINNDQYMDGKTKIRASMPFHSIGEGKTGVVSTQDLVRGAVRAGFGLAGGYIAGRTLGTIFGAPQPVTQMMSATGALAGALTNTGVF